jgi:transposase
MKRDGDELELLLQKLRWLRLPGMARTAGELLAEAAKKNLTPLEVVHRLCDEEKKSRIDGAIRRRIRDTRFPELTTVDGFDFEFDPCRKKLKARYLALHDLAFVDRGINPLFIGHPSTGKTFLARALAYRACQATRRVVFTSSPAPEDAQRAGRCRNPRRPRQGPMRQLKRSRRQVFEELERAALKPLPPKPYEFARWARPRVHVDYHVEYDDHFYSVRYQLVGKQVDLRATETTIEIFLGGRQETSHLRSYEKGKHTTKPEHMPKAHQAQVEWTPVRLVAWANKTGPATAAVVEEIMRRRVHPQQGFRACLGILHLSRRYPPERIEAACARALRVRACTYRSVVAILRNNLDREEPPGPPEQWALPVHGNIRGSGYYH